MTRRSARRKDLTRGSQCAKQRSLKRDVSLLKHRHIQVWNTMSISDESGDPAAVSMAVSAKTDW